MIIIDTHIWIWWSHDIERLNKVQLEALKANETTTIGVSAYFMLGDFKAL